MEFTASNGVTVESETQAITGYRRIKFCTDSQGETFELSGEYMKALIEALDHERDEELGRWRWPENPNYVAYLTDSNRAVVVDEASGYNMVIYRDHEIRLGGGLYASAALAYFETRPERKPWMDAKPGDVWAVAIGGEEQFCVTAVAGLFGAVSFRGVGGREVDMSSSAHSGARKVWPESD